MSEQANQPDLYQPSSGAFGGKGYIDLSPTKNTTTTTNTGGGSSKRSPRIPPKWRPIATNKKELFFYMAVAAVSVLLGMTGTGITAVVIVGACAVPFYYRASVGLYVEDWIRFNKPNFIAPVVLSWLMLMVSSGLAYGFFNNGIPYQNSFSGFFWFIGAGFVAYNTYKFWRFTLYNVQMAELAGLTDEVLDDFPNAKGWATPAEVARRFGLPTDRDWLPNEIKGVHIGNGIHTTEQGHILTLGGSGQGKGACLVLPALTSNGLVNGGVSVVCLDPKGENAAVSAPFLRDRGYDVHVINPFGIKEIAHLGNSRWNPFDLVEEGEDKKFCDLLAYSIHNKQSKGDGEFFNTRCRQYISLYARYVLHKNRQTDNLRDMPLFEQLYRLLKMTGDQRDDLLANMATNETFKGAADAEAILARLKSDAARTEENIYGTIESAINILEDEKLQSSLAASDFDLRQIAQKPMAIFICVRHDELEYYATWIRMFADTLLKTLTRHYNVNRKVLVLLDEFAQLGYIDQFAKVPAILRGYNVTLWPIVQNVGQLIDLYGKETFETFFANTFVKQYFGGYGGNIDNTTADYIVKRLPKTVDVQYDKQSGRPLGYEKPLLDLPGFIAYQKIIGETRGVPAPFEIEKVPYWKWKFCMGNYSANPFDKK